MLARIRHFSKNRLSQIDEVFSIFIFVSDRRTIQDHDHKINEKEASVGENYIFFMKNKFRPQAYFESI